MGFVVVAPAAVVEEARKAVGIFNDGAVDKSWIEGRSRFGTGDDGRSMTERTRIEENEATDYDCGGNEKREVELHGLSFFCTTEYFLNWRVLLF